MTAGVLVAVLALGLVAVATRPEDGRAETALALPLLAAVAVASPLALPVALGGVAIAYAALAVLEARTLLFGRRLRAGAACVGAVVPLGTLALGATLGRLPSHPEVWLAGAVVPGVLAYDLRRSPAGRRPLVAATSTASLVVLLGVGLVVGARVGALTVDPIATGPGPVLPSIPLSAVAVVALGGLAAGVLVRWRYGLHAGPLSIPLVALWSLETALVPLTYVGGLALTWLALPVLEEHRGGRRLAALAGVVGALASAGALAVGGGVAWLAILVAGVLAAEDARLFRGHAGRDRTHAVAIAASGYALLVTAGGLARSWASAGVPEAVVAAAITSLLVLAVVVGRRERSRPSERRLQADEWRWTP